MTALHRAWSAVRTGGLVVAGFAALDVAVFTMAGPWGWVAVAGSLFALDALIEHHQGVKP